MEYIVSFECFPMQALQQAAHVTEKQLFNLTMVSQGILPELSDGDQVKLTENLRLLRESLDR